MELLSKPAAVIPRLSVTAIVPLLAKSAATILALPVILFMILSLMRALLLV